jgi:hypothetical protein
MWTSSGPFGKSLSKRDGNSRLCRKTRPVSASRLAILKLSGKNRMDFQRPTARGDTGIGGLFPIRKRNTRMITQRIADNGHGR